ncbi:DUF5941 domain-containing protein [Streptomyces sp. B6B3]|uniref:DUF5941 domain-containing protein n=1 Tax=Streptomyces sp. B6B3 TaxID=3153570 RepID=UPI00325DD4E5
MSIAILTGPPLAGTSLTDDLRALGFSVRVADEAAEPGGLVRELAAVPAGERVAVVDPRFTGHRHSLRLGLTDPRFPAAAVPGAVTVQHPARAALAAAVPADQPVGTGDPEPAGPAAGTAPGGTAPTAAPPTTGLADRIAARLAAAGTPVHRPELGTLVAEVPDTAADRERALARIAAVDDEAVRLRTAVKSRDGFFTTHFVSPYSRYLARWCARRGLTPNQVTTASLLTALVAAGCAATGTRAGYVAAAVLLLASFVLDCADGQLARYALRYSTLGAWLDATFDRAKEYAFYAGLALGAARNGDDVWALALAAMALQTCRHIVDFAFNEAHQTHQTHQADHGKQVPAAGDAPDTPTTAARRNPAATLSGRLDRIGWTVWLRRMVVLPIGERWALIAVLTALTTPRTTLVVLLVAGGFAACYTTAGRLLRSTRRTRTPEPAAGVLADLTDSGPLATALSRPGPRGTGAFTAPLWALAGVLSLLGVLLLAGAGWYAVGAAALYALCAGRALAGPLDRPLDWLLPPLFRAGEYGGLLVLAVTAGASGASDNELHNKVNTALPAAFVLMAACAYHHYDTVYRLRGGAGAPPRWLTSTTGGHEGRVLVITAAAALWAEGQGFTTALAALGGALALLVLGESIRFWISSRAPAVHDETGVPG